MIIDRATRTIRRIAVGKEQDFTFRRREYLDIPQLSRIDLYLHIPFCKTLCPHCPYNRIKYDEALVEPYTRSVLNEIEQYFSRLGRVEISSLYIGGGTPTTMTAGLGTIIRSLREKFNITGNIGIETSPGDLNRETIKALTDMGVNMISLGVQSFDDPCLKALGRNYDSAQAHAAVDLACSAGFETVNLDLMFTLPGQRLEKVLEDMKEAIRTGADQVTVYPLFTFPYSSIGRYRRINRVKMPDFFQRRQMYKAIQNYFTRSGYHQVSVWGFEKDNLPRYSSVTRDTYIGLGAGAGSRLPNVFYFNTFSVKEYIETALSGRLPIAIAMDMTPKLQKYYWLYWRLYETCIDQRRWREEYGENRLTQSLFKIMEILGLSRQKENQITLTERGAFYIHLLQNYFMLGYINKVWTAAMSEPWPERIEI